MGSCSYERTPDHGAPLLGPHVLGSTRRSAVHGTPLWSRPETEVGESHTPVTMTALRGRWYISLSHFSPPPSLIIRSGNSSAWRREKDNKQCSAAALSQTSESKC